MDAGYHGTLNWTVTNTSSEERRFVYRERLYRLTIFKLGPGENPAKLYEGEYQDQIGYVRSSRAGAPVGMRADEWEDSAVEGGPEQLLENLMKSGYPWHVLGQRLKIVDDQFKSVTHEYGEIHDSISKLTKEVDALTRQNNEATRTLPQTIRSILEEQATALQNRWLLAAGSLGAAFVGLYLSVTSNAQASAFVKDHGSWIGIALVLLGCGVVVLVSRRQKPRKS